MLPFPLSDLWALPRLGPPGCGCRPGLKYKLKWSHLKTFNLNKNWFSFQLTRLTLLMTFGDGMEKSSIRSILFLTMWSSSTSDIPKKVWNRFRDYDISEKAQKVCKSILKCAKNEKVSRLSDIPETLNIRLVLDTKTETSCVMMNECQKFPNCIYSTSRQCKTYQSMIKVILSKKR